MSIEVDFDYECDHGMLDMVDVQNALKTVLDSGAESTNCHLKLLRVVSPKPKLPAAPRNGDLSVLPVGTVFYVHNGAWNGRVIMEDGEKKILVIATGGKYSLKESKDYGLQIRIEDYEIPVE